jgi:lipopolysaccharide/colanic/teichoic acid biosynthesis glycosyltransferase
MLKNSPSIGTGSLTVRNDPRVLPFGKFLRRTKINELPQVFNVLNGTMSIVGPRPQMEIDFYRFPKHVQEMIYNYPPGITGIGSLVFRDEERFISALGDDPIQVYCDYIAPYKGELELWYQNHASLWVDTKLIFLTAWSLLSPKTKLYFKWFKDLPPMPEKLLSC